MKYYEPPSQECFDEVKEEAIGIWSVMGDEPSYSREKIDRIQDLPNIQDNFMYMIAMFDLGNQAKLAQRLSEETRKEVSDRIIDGGTPPEYNVFK